MESLHKYHMNLDDISKENLGTSDYIDFARKELAWASSDNEKRYLSNMKNPITSRILNDLGWINTKITYQFNSAGFRADEFEDQPSIVFLGCSVTFGVGLPLNKTWPYLVSKDLNLANYNLGMPGKSNDTAFRLAYSWLEKLNPKLVVFCQTYDHRIEVFDNKMNENVFIQWEPYPIAHHLNKIKNCLAIKMLCDNLKIKFIETDCEKVTIKDKARDLMHPGVVSNKDFAKYVINLIS